MLSIRSRCWLCRQPLSLMRHGLCSCCLRHLPARPPCCPRCGLPAGETRTPCGRCLQRPPPWQRLVFVGDYVTPLSLLVKRFKFHRAPELAPALARLILLRWQQARAEQYLNRPDLILAVPLHATRCWRRGYNQSDLLARPLARWLGCAYRPAALRRVRKTALQQRLSASARRRNLQRAFVCTVPVAGRHIALVDDVVTTGSTVSAIAALLRRQGAASVQIWCVCRTL
ncbi:amidophosphoribosyltransferase [Acinetobacter baumannii]|uniref:DNA utilization protein GntX n=1 Tax=Serratia ureilytica TaxID=300181 RepID=UPI000B8E90F7|nr:DNA utilization protein GntX [Serratia ureilytica]MEB5995809.1 DNA utilization protein GntX [Serratia ureilytica]SVK45868.1 amidophosphoribosyltransferase [Acinetobacter baumannii]